MTYDNMQVIGEFVMKALHGIINEKKMFIYVIKKEIFNKT